MKDIKTTCAYCKKDPGADPRNTHLANGFWDGDMKVFVCWKCKRKHYKVKSKTEFAGLYTEFPAPLERKSA